MLELVLAVGVEALRLIPLILALYLPALVALVLLKERGEGYKAKAAAVLVLGAGLVLFVNIVFTGNSVSQDVGIIALGMVQFAVALLLAYLTVYKLAD